jgi:signal transduction histidine kinase
MPEDRSRPTADELAAGYDLETASLLRERLGLGVVIFIVCVGLSMGADAFMHPERAAAGSRAFGAEALVCALGLGVAMALPRARQAASVVTAATLVAIMAWYNVLIDSSVERLALMHIAFLCGIAVLLPWSWRAQVAVAVVALGAFAVAVPHLHATDSVSAATFAYVATAGSSVAGAHFLWRHRREAFEHAALLAHASTVSREEADVSAALMRVSQELNANLGEPDVLERVNALVVEVLGVDFSSTLTWDEERGVFRFAASTGHRPEVLAELAHVEFPIDAAPAARRLLAGETLEVPAAAGQTLVPADLMTRWGATAVLLVPIATCGRVTGVLTAGHQERSGPFAVQQRRLAAGIAHATAAAFENARLIQDLRAANSLKSEFVTTMSHELRTPLNVISGYGDLLIDGAFGPLTEGQADTLARMRRSTLELLELVNATLQANRIEAGREQVALVPVDVARLADELRTELDPLVPAGVTMRWDTAQVDRPVTTDPDKVKTILRNLVGNGLKFTSAGTVETTMAWAADRLTLRVRDTGVGIEPDALPVVFDMFRQGDGSSTRRFGGVGLGLHIVKRLVDLLGGTVSVTSIRDRGSTFTVSIPAHGVADPRHTDPRHVSGRERSENAALGGTGERRAAAGEAGAAERQPPPPSRSTSS